MKSPCIFIWSFGVPLTENSMQALVLGCSSSSSGIRPGETRDCVDIQSLLAYYLGSGRYLASRDLSAQNGYYIAVLALAANPFVILFLTDNVERHLHIHCVRLEKELLQDIAALAAVSLDKDSQRERMVNVGLANVEHSGSMTGENLG